MVLTFTINISTGILVLCSFVLGLAGITLIIWGLLGDRSKGRARCPSCWYDMRGRTGLRCPECGYDSGEESNLFRNHIRWGTIGIGFVLVAGSTFFWGVFIAVNVAMLACGVAIIVWVLLPGRLICLKGGRPRSSLRFLALIPSMLLMFVGSFLLTMQYSASRERAIWYSRKRHYVDIGPSHICLLPTWLDPYVPRLFRSPFYRLAHVNYELGLGAIGKDIELLKNFSYLKSLAISSDGITPADLVYLRDLPYLRFLTFEMWRGDRHASIPHIVVLTQLQRLDLGYALELTNEDVRQISQLKSLQWLAFYNIDVRNNNKSNVTDIGIAYLKDLPNLEYLNLGANVTAVSLDHLKELKRLHHLCLSGCHIMDEGVAELGHLTGLRYLDLIRTNITDADLTHLQGLVHLEQLCLGHTAVTASGKAKLQAALPNLWISDDDYQMMRQFTMNYRDLR